MTGKQIARAMRSAAVIADRKRTDGYCVGLCDSVCMAGYGRTVAEALEIMRPTRAHCAYWWGTCPCQCSDTDHNARILGALFAAHYAEDDL